MDPSETLERFMNDPDAPKFLDQPHQEPKPQLQSVTITLSKPGVSSKNHQASFDTASSEPSTRPSSPPGTSILSQQESRSSNTSTAPSNGQESLVGDIETMSIGGQRHRLECILNGIIDCPITFSLSEEEEWYSHSLSHYGDARPPPSAMCIFCHTEFTSSDPSECWSERMGHIAEHFRNGRTLQNSRPDFNVIKDMWEKDCIPEYVYRHCMNHTERPRCDTLRPHDYIPKCIEEKQRAAYEQGNRVIVKPSRQEQRHRARGKRLAMPKSKAIVK